MVETMRKTGFTIEEYSKRHHGGISGSLTGVFGGGILLFDGLLLLPAGKRVAGKLGIFLQRFLVQNIYICLFQLTLCLGCFAVRLQLVAAIALPHQISTEFNSRHTGRQLQRAAKATAVAKYPLSDRFQIMR